MLEQFVLLILLHFKCLQFDILTGLQDRTNLDADWILHVLANDFANLAPMYISFRTGGLITGVIGVMMMPWKLLSDFSSYIFGWLVGYSGLLGPIAGVMIADYFVIRKSRLVVDDLYRRSGEYEYSGGFNYRALVALAAGVVVALVGLFVPSLRWLYDYAWFVGFFVAGVLYCLLMRSTAGIADRA